MAVLIIYYFLPQKINIKIKLYGLLSAGHLFFFLSIYAFHLIRLILYALSFRKGTKVGWNFTNFFFSSNSKLQYGQINRAHHTKENLNIFIKLLDRIYIPFYLLVLQLINYFPTKLFSYLREKRKTKIEFGWRTAGFNIIKCHSLYFYICNTFESFQFGYLCYSSSYLVCIKKKYSVHVVY